jgi:hypothetical protein
VAVPLPRIAWPPSSSQSLNPQSPIGRPARGPFLFRVVVGCRARSAVFRSPCRARLSCLNHSTHNAPVPLMLAPLVPSPSDARADTVSSSSRPRHWAKNSTAVYLVGPPRCGWPDHLILGNVSILRREIHSPLRKGDPVKSAWQRMTRDASVESRNGG